ncbi:MAG: S9 family peptidase [Bacillota bacterium]
MSCSRSFVFWAALCLASLAGGGVAALAANSDPFTLDQALSYPYPSELTAAPGGSALAWAEQDPHGVRNVWVLDGPGTTPRQLTHYTGDDGQELSHLSISRDGQYLVFVRGGDHDANWPEALEPGPDSMPMKPAMQVWSVGLKDGKLQLLGDGDQPVISPDSRRVTYIHLPERSVWQASVTGGDAAQLFFDRGKADDLEWSPDGKALAFVSARGDHSFIGVFRDTQTPILYLAPSTAQDFMPRWSPDGSQIAFVRMPGEGGAPKPILKQTPNPWALWVADVQGGKGRQVWQSPETLRGSYPETEGEANLHWLAGGRLLFLADMDNWPHLYSVPVAGGNARLLTPGAFMVEDVAVNDDGTHVIYSANAGNTPGDLDRRHLFLLQVESGAQIALTSGDTLEWKPTLSGDGKTLGFIQAGVQTPPLIVTGNLDDRIWRSQNRDHIPAEFPANSFVTPQPVSFKASDGMVAYGELFDALGSDARKPAVIFVHGGPPRQMLLGWHYMDYYSNAYAVNQYLAAHGFVVLALNYRLGIGYGHDFHHPPQWGPTGAAEYKDVLAAARFLQRDPHVDAKHIGIWGGSYGGYLTALALARDSGTFKAGVDMHGVHDWSYDLSEWFTEGKPRYEEGDHKQAMKVAWQSSPVSSVKTWRSPVLLIQGDDDRNVYFHEMVDLVNRLQQQHVRYQQLVLPNEIHGFLRRTSWRTADQATVDFFRQEFLPQGN